MTNVCNALVIAILASATLLCGCSETPRDARDLVCWKSATTAVSEKALFKNIWALPVVTTVGSEGQRRFTLVNDGIVCEEE